MTVAAIDGGLATYRAQAGALASVRVSHLAGGLATASRQVSAPHTWNGWSTSHRAATAAAAAIMLGSETATLARRNAAHLTVIDGTHTNGVQAVLTALDSELGELAPDVTAVAERIIEAHPHYDCEQTVACTKSVTTTHLRDTLLRAGIDWPDMADKETARHILAPGESITITPPGCPAAQTYQERKGHPLAAPLWQAAQPLTHVDVTYYRPHRAPAAVLKVEHKQGLRPRRVKKIISALEADMHPHLLEPFAQYLADVDAKKVASQNRLALARISQKLNPATASTALTPYRTN